jgi:hypothetical protein
VRTASSASYQTTGAADPAKVRLAGWLDGVAALVLTMIAWPFPVLRAAVPWSVHAPLVLVAILAADAGLRFASLLVWGRTPFMYLLDLGLEGGPPRIHAKAAVRWSLGWTLSLVPSLLGARSLADPMSGLAARFSGLATRSTA